MYVLNNREIRKIRRILEKKQNHPVNVHFKLEVQRPARNLWLGRDSRILRKLQTANIFDENIWIYYIHKILAVKKGSIKSCMF